MLNPKLFISYSWTTREHEEWVLELATRLVSFGVDVIIDKWLLREGHDLHAFMEQMVTDDDIQKVILVCDKAYAEKANSREGGVGKEAQIISGEIYSKKDQSKFVAVVTEKDKNGYPYIPAYYISRIYIDMSDKATYNDNFERIIRWIYDKQLHEKPELGKIPSFLTGKKGDKLNFVNDEQVKTTTSAYEKDKSSQIFIEKINEVSVRFENIEQKSNKIGGVDQLFVGSITGGNVVFKNIKQEG